MWSLEYARILSHEYLKDCGQGSEPIWSIVTLVPDDQLLSEVTMEPQLCWSNCYLLMLFCICSVFL